MNTNQRTAGILLHITSLPGRYGSGDMGREAYRFVDWLRGARQSVWQVLPLGPTGYGDSPYQCFSAFAGNPLLISLDLLADEGWLEPADLGEVPGAGAPDQVSFEQVTPFRRKALAASYARFQQQATMAERDEFDTFQETERDWLQDYALFMTLKESQGNGVWTSWPDEFRRRGDLAVLTAHSGLVHTIELHKYIQFQFYRQWFALKKYANKAGIRIMGDVPIFVAHDSADVWTHQAIFDLRSDGNPRVVAGVPPDYFSSTGQLWGNPLYRWPLLAKSGYAWWVKRMRAALTMFDMVRLDHFRGFEAYYEVPAGEPTAENGHWVPGPGADLFRVLERELGPLPLVAEDLGLITPPVEALRDELGFPGMRVLQFAFGKDDKAIDYQPHNYVRHCVVYTGTHDNDTAVGWFRSQSGAGSTRLASDIEAERQFALKYLGSDGQEIHWDLIRAAWSSVAEMAIVPMQDLLGLGTEARMNLPGTSSNNWRWRLDPALLSEEPQRRLAEFTTMYGRV